jgi:hypothetical protein
MNMRSERKLNGQALVEVALTLPLILLLILGAMDFGRLFTTKLVLNNAAREGAYYITSNLCDAVDGYVETRNAAITEAEGLGVDPTALDIEVTYRDIYGDSIGGCNLDENGCCIRGEMVTVTVSQGVDLIFGGALQALGLVTGPITLSSEVSMVVQ